MRTKSCDSVLDADFRQQEAHELARTALGLKYKRGARRAVELRQQVKQQSGLAHSRSCNQGQEAAIRLDPVIKGCKRFAMTRPQIQVPRVRRNPERLFSKAEKV